MKATYNYATHKKEVWYSEEEYNELLTALERIKNYLKTAEHTNNGFKFFELVDNAYEIANNFLKNNKIQ